MIETYNEPIDLSVILEYNRKAEIFRMSFKFCKLYYGYSPNTVNIYCSENKDKVRQVSISPDRRFIKSSNHIVEKDYREYLLKIPISLNESIMFDRSEQWKLKDLPLF